MRIDGKFSPSAVSGDALLDYFAPCPIEQIRWRSADEARAAGVSKTRVAKLLKLENRPAGNRPCYGRGAIVMCSGHQLLTADIADALASGYAWPWDRGAPLGSCALPARYFGAVNALLARYDVPSSYPAREAVRVIVALRKAVEIRPDGAFAWLTQPHDSKPAGSLIEGSALSAPRGRFFTTEKLAFLFDDVRFAFEHGRWPWEPENDCFSVDWD